MRSVSQISVILWLVAHFLMSKTEREKKLAFLVTGEDLEYTEKIRTQRLYWSIKLDFDKAAKGTIIATIEEIMEKWTTFPPLKEEEGLSYYQLTESAPDLFLTAMKLLGRLEPFRDITVPFTPNLECVYEHKVIQMAKIESDLTNLVFTQSHIKADWTLTDLQTDPSKDQIVRIFATLLIETLEDLEFNLRSLLNTLDSLASHKVSQDMQGMYQEAPCVGSIVEEDIVIRDCYPTKLGYLCEIDISVPLNFKNVFHMLPVSYSNIQLRGETESQLIIQDRITKMYQYLSCDHYQFNEEKIPLCETHAIANDCHQALKADEYTNIIQNCNFTKKDPLIITRTQSLGLLVLGDGTYTQYLKGTDTIKLTDRTPVLLFTSQTLTAIQGQETRVMSALNTTLTSQEIYTDLTDNMIDSLSARLYWQLFLEDMDIEDLTRYLILVFQIILAPLTMVGLILGIRARKLAIATLLTRRKSLKNIYRQNKLSLRTFDR